MPTPWGYFSHLGRRALTAASGFMLIKPRPRYVIPTYCLRIKRQCSSNMQLSQNKYWHTKQKQTNKQMINIKADVRGEYHKNQRIPNIQRELFCVCVCILFTKDRQKENEKGESSFVCACVFCLNVNKMYSRKKEHERERDSNFQEGKTALKFFFPHVALGPGSKVHQKTPCPDAPPVSIWSPQPTELHDYESLRVTVLGRIRSGSRNFSFCVSSFSLLFCSDSVLPCQLREFSAIQSVIVKKSYLYIVCTHRTDQLLYINSIGRLKCYC